MVFILGVSADIGRDLAVRYVEAGGEVVGTYRQPETIEDLRGRPGLHLLPCDVSRPDSVAALVEAYGALGRPWDLFISAVGSMEPIGPYFSVDFDAWERSVILNSTGQLRVLHALYPHRRPDRPAHVVLMAGGGTNNPFTNYSAYCVSKILLIKMCELLDDEVADLNAFIIGPGFVPTKIHRQTLRNAEAAGRNYEKTVEFYQAESGGTPYQDIFDCINWGIAVGRAVVGGRNLSVVHDPWRDGGERLAAQLRGDPDKFKLRRAANVDARPAQAS